MQETEKLKSNKDIIAFLVERFPECFSAKGEVKPLKIGIFDDLSKALADEPRVSKTRLRSALRHYTSSWRYLRGMKPGKQRVDLEGQPCGELEQQHAEHAQKALEESLEKHGIKPNEPRKPREPRQRRPKAAEGKAADSRPARPKTSKVNNKSRGTRPAASSAAPSVNVSKASAEMKPVDPNLLSTGQQVQVKVGGSVVTGTVLEISKGDVQVQLVSGMQVRVKKNHIVA